MRPSRELCPITELRPQAFCSPQAGRPGAVLGGTGGHGGNRVRHRQAAVIHFPAALVRTADPGRLGDNPAGVDGETSAELCPLIPAV